MANKTILVVEDNYMNQEIAVELLQAAGFDTLTAEDADTAVAITRERQPDLVLMDLHLPGKDGYAACREIRATPNLAQPRIVAFTALAMTTDQQKAVDAGCDGILFKPIEVENFAKQVGSFLDPENPA